MGCWGEALVSGQEIAWGKFLKFKFYEFSIKSLSNFVIFPAMVSTVNGKTMVSVARTTSIACVVRKMIKQRAMESGVNGVHVREVVRKIKANEPGPEIV